MPLSAAVRLALRDLKVIVILKDLVESDNRQNDLIKSFAKILGTFLSNPGMLSFKLRRLMSKRRNTSIFYKLLIVRKVV